MWFATVSNKTVYHGGTQILDSDVNATVSYTPPVVNVVADDLLGIKVGDGLLEAICKPTNQTLTGSEAGNTKVLFRAKFSDLEGTGSAKVVAPKGKPGVTMSFDHMDLTK